ncbi:helix-turn-helix domain-containing protein [Actinoplanes sp. NPDC049265]|uniref:helix-turn-helix domain-containing protein n=1 Tax=Actinoplanes sp. NPDC049265 TaxID=3363902 RepID=UPI0037142AB8
MDNALGDFLRARRELVTPAEVGLPPGHGLRRVPGLRREEVAMLAGISAEYYLRLEQGRDRSPSAQVIDAISAVLQLDPEGTAYLMALAAPKSRRRPAQREPRLPAGLDLLLGTINVPAFVIDQYMDVVASNALAQRLFPDMLPGVNRLRSLFLDPSSRTWYPAWDHLAAAAIAHLRARAGADTGDERLRTLIGEMSLKSETFRTLWARHDVGLASAGRVLLHHPTAGPLELLTEKFAVVGTDGLEALLLHAEPGTPTAEALDQLSSSLTQSGASSSTETA